MQRLGSPSVFPALPGASAQLWKCQTRHHSRRWWKPRKWGPRRRDAWPTFDIPDLLLDLDAEGVKGVRAFDSQLDGVPESRSALREREIRPIKERVAEFEKGYQECQSSFQAISADKFHPLHISDVDLLAATLFDSPNALEMTANSPYDADDPTTHAGMLDSVLDGNGIPRTVRNDTSNTIAYMLRRRQSLEESDTLSPRPDDEGLFSMAFSRYATFHEIDRLVARMTHTPEGCRTLSRLSDELHTSLTGLVPEVKPFQLLSLLNNLLINFDRCKLHMSSSLLNLGIWTSLKCQAIVTAQQYIQRKAKHGYFSKSTIDSILNQLQASITSTQFNSHEFQSNPASRLTTMYSLLTGYVPGENRRTVFLRSLISRERESSPHLYIQCLARLGAFRTIWHEWHATDSASQDINSITKLDSSFAKNGYFVTAILEALRNNEHIRGLARSPEFANVTGQFREDCQLDLTAISKSAEILALPEKEKGNHGSSPARVRQSEQLYQIFSEKQIQKAFPTLQAFLIQTDTFS